MPHQQYAAAIQAARAKAGWTQRDLASRIGVHELAVSRWERAATIPSMEHRIALVDVLNIDGDQLDVPNAGTPPEWAQTLMHQNAEILDRLHAIQTECCDQSFRGQTG